MRKSVNNKGRTLRFEGLEDRAMLNGTVLASTSAGVLSLIGDSNANYLTVHQTGSGGGGAKIQVVGAATKIQNLDTGKIGASFTFTGIKGVDIELNCGNDSLVFYNTTLTCSASIDMGSGNDVLSMANVKARDFGRAVFLEPAFEHFWN